MRKRINFAIFVALLLVLGLVLSSCGILYFRYEVDMPELPDADDLDDIPEPEANSKNEANIIDFNIPNDFDPSGMLEKFYPYNFNSAYITVATISDNNSLFAGTGFFTDSTISERNFALESALNLKLNELSTDLATLSKKLTSSVSTNTYYADLIAVPLSAVKSFEGKNLFCSIDSLPFIDSSEIWFSEHDGIALDSEHFICGSASILASETKVLFYNSSLANELGISSPHSLLSSKAWTWNKLISCLGEDGKIGVSEDIKRIVEATIKSESEENTEKVSMITEALTSHAINEDAKDAFLAGECLFYLGTLADLSDTSKNESHISLLPIPIFEEGDNYSDVRSSDDVTVFACPGGYSLTERSAFILNALNAASYNSFSSAFSEICESGLLSDNSSTLALGYIFTAETEIFYAE